MKKFSTEKSVTVLLNLLMILTLLAVIFVGVIHPPMADDYNYRVSQFNKSLFQYLSAWYNGWYGRMQGTFLLWFAVQSPMAINIFGVLNALAFVVSVYLGVVLAFGRWPDIFGKDRLLFILTFSTMWFGLPVIGETVFWRTGAAIYLWANLFACLLLIPYRIWTPQSCVCTGIRKYFLALLMFLYGIWVGFAQEQLLGILLTFFTIWLTLVWRANLLKSVPIWLYSGISGVIVGGAIMVLAPGNSIRLGLMSHPSWIAKAVYSINYFSDLIGNQSGLLTWLLLLAFLWIGWAAHYTRDRMEVLYNLPWNARTTTFFLWLAASLAGFVPLFFLNYWVLRTGYFPVFFLIVAFISLSPLQEISIWAYEGKGRVVTSMLLCFVLLTVIIDAKGTALTAYSLRLEIAAREKLIYDAKLKGKTSVVVPPFDIKETRTVYVADISSDRNYYINDGWQRYYGIGTILPGMVQPPDLAQFSLKLYLEKLLGIHGK